VAIAGYMYVLTSTTIWNAQIQGDGTLAGWRDQINANPDNLTSFGFPTTPVIMGGYDATGWPNLSFLQGGVQKGIGFLYVVGNTGAVYRYCIDSLDGDVEYIQANGSDVPQPSLPAAVSLGAVHVDDSGYIYVVGGEVTGTPSATSYYATCNV